MSVEEILRQIVREEIREAMQDAGTDDRLLTAEQVAALLAYSEHQVHRLKREGKLRGFMLGGNSLRFRRSEVERYIREKEQAA